MFPSCHTSPLFRQPGPSARGPPWPFHCRRPGLSATAVLPQLLLPCPLLPWLLLLWLPLLRPSCRGCPAVAVLPWSFMMQPLPLRPLMSRPQPLMPRLVTMQLSSCSLFCCGRPNVAVPRPSLTCDAVVSAVADHTAAFLPRHSCHSRSCCGRSCGRPDGVVLMPSLLLAVAVLLRPFCRGRCCSRSCRSHSRGCPGVAVPRPSLLWPC